MSTRKIKVWTRNARHAHAGKDLDVVGDTKDYRAGDREDCLFYPDCFDDVARGKSRQVCPLDCPRYAQIRRQA
jgi:hypothetical protein